MDWEYVRGYWGGSGWLARLVGDFLTQFYYYLYAGAVIMTLMLLVLGDLARRDVENVLKMYIKTPSKVVEWVPFAFGVSMMVLGFLFSFDHSYKLAGIVSMAGSFGLFWLATLIPKRLKWVKAIGDALAIFLSFWALGFGELPWGKFSAPEYTLEKTLAFDNEYYFGNYDKVIEMGREGDMNEEMNFFYCMALEKKGMLVQEVMNMEKPNLGTFYEIGPETPRFVIRMIDELYYLIGDMTYTERAALLANTFSENSRSARKIKRLAEANLINGDNPAAMKYLRLLEKTIVYKRWAIAHMPGSQTDAVQLELANKQQYINTSDNIRIGDDCYTILTQLLDSNPDNTPALDYLLLSDMIAGQKEVFARDYEKYGGEKRAEFRGVYESAKGEDK